MRYIFFVLVCIVLPLNFVNIFFGLWSKVPSRDFSRYGGSWPRWIRICYFYSPTTYPLKPSGSSTSSMQKDFFFFPVSYTYDIWISPIRIYVHETERKKKYRSEKNRENDRSLSFWLGNLFLKIFARDLTIPLRENFAIMFNFSSSFQWYNFYLLCTKLKKSNRLIWAPLNSFLAFSPPTT